MATKRKVEQYSDRLGRLFPEERSADRVSARNVTFQVTDACNLCCTYCYQTHKGCHEMPFDVAKRFIDMLLNDETTYVNRENSGGVIIEFIGGEPFLAIDLIDQITDYFISQMIEKQHPWATRYMISICSNGLLYFDPKVQAYMNKHRRHLSFSITIDGNKELHDSCRIQPDGSGSYDIAMAGVKDWISKGGYMGSKITVAPANVVYVFEAVKSIIENGYDDININCVFEEGWTAEHALILYNQLKLIADYMIDNNLTETHRVAMFEENFFKPKEENDDKCWCFAAGTPVLTPFGYKAIDQLQAGDLVYTENGEIHPIEKVHKHFADNVVKTKISGAFELTCTDNHKFFTKKFDYLDYKGVKHFKDADKIELKDIKHKDLVELSCLPNNRTKHVDYDLAWKTGYYQVDEPISKECFTWDDDSLRAFIDGYVDANGHYSKIRARYSCSTVSKELAQDILLILRTIGYNPTCHFEKRAGKSTIEGREVNIRDRYEIYYYNDTSRAKYVRHYDDGVWTYGMSTAPAEPQEVYNITVKDNHSYIAGDFCVSNCGGLGSMIAVDYKGDVFPCLRYMESSLGTDQPPVIIGNVYDGIAVTQCQQDCIACMKAVTRRTYNTDECFYCPIAAGCADCAAYNYQVYGTFNKRATFICIMHKARALANVYYWNKVYRSQGLDKRFENHVPDKWALEIIDQEELDMLKELAK